MSKMRTTQHNSRGDKKSSQGYTPKHNDRDFDNLENLIGDVKDNFYYSWKLKGFVPHEVYKAKYKSFDDSESEYYSLKFKAQWQEQQDKYDASRQTNRKKEFDVWRMSKRYCPEEQYIQIGDYDNHADKDTLKKASIDYIKWQLKWSKEHGEPFKILDIAIHNDEAVPQMHIRRVWQYKDGDIWKVGQDRALEHAGVGLPNPNEKKSRYNNRKMVFDKMCRDKWIEICESYGLDIEKTPLPDGTKHNRSKEQVLYDKFNNRVKAVEQREEQVKQREEQVKQREDNVKQREDNVASVMDEINTLRDTYQDILLTMSYEKAQAIRNRNIDLETRYAELLEKTKDYDHSLGE